MFKPIIGKVAVDEQKIYWIQMLQVQSLCFLRNKALHATTITLRRSVRFMFKSWKSFLIQERTKILEWKASASSVTSHIIWIAPWHVSPGSGYCDRAGCHVLCLQHGISVYHC